MVDFTRTFETDRVFLRPMIKEDQEAFSGITGDKDLWIYFTHDLSDEKGLEEWMNAGLEGLKSKTRFALTVIDQQSGSIVGSTSLGNISLRDRRLEIGWTWLGREAQGKGINDQVKHLLLQYCFEDLGLERVEFKTDVLNLHARKALERIGATEEGILRSHTLMTHGRRRDTLYYSILRQEWEGLRKVTGSNTE